MIPVVEAKTPKFGAAWLVLYERCGDCHLVTNETLPRYKEQIAATVAWAVATQNADVAQAYSEAATTMLSEAEKAIARNALNAAVREELKTFPQPPTVGAGK